MRDFHGVDGTCTLVKRSCALTLRLWENEPWKDIIASQDAFSDEK
jgi:hypothetical protein